MQEAPFPSSPSSPGLRNALLVLGAPYAEVLYASSIFGRMSVRRDPLREPRRAAVFDQLSLSRLSADYRYGLCPGAGRAHRRPRHHPGEPTYYTSQADSGETVSRGFCPECGSGIFSKLSANPDIVGLKAASLDDPSWFRPAVDIYTDSAQPWM